jgi:hypothetical protein
MRTGLAIGFILNAKKGNSNIQKNCKTQNSNRKNPNSQKQNTNPNPEELREELFLAAKAAKDPKRETSELERQRGGCLPFAPSWRMGASGNGLKPSCSSRLASLNPMSWTPLSSTTAVAAQLLVFAAGTKRYASKVSWFVVGGWPGFCTISFVV